MVSERTVIALGAAGGGLLVGGAAVAVRWPPGVVISGVGMILLMVCALADLWNSPASDDQLKEPWD